jgi:hypothetical protein
MRKRERLENMDTEECRQHMGAVFDKRLMVAETMKYLGLTKDCQG